jgi:hypothetical protein
VFRPGPSQFATTRPVYSPLGVRPTESRVGPLSIADFGLAGPTATGPLGCIVGFVLACTALVVRLFCGRDVSLCAAQRTTAEAGTRGRRDGRGRERGEW